MGCCSGKASKIIEKSAKQPCSLVLGFRAFHTFSCRGLQRMSTPSGGRVFSSMCEYGVENKGHFFFLKKERKKDET